MESIEQHIKKDKDIIDDPTSNPAARRHAKVELEELELMQNIIKMRLKQVIIMTLML